jgi:hypothetical protein
MAEGEPKVPLEDQMWAVATSMRPAVAARPVGPAIEGENGAELMSRLPVIHFHELYSAAQKYKRFKFISLFAVVPEIELSGDYCQFGVFTGMTARFFTNYVPSGSRLHLFDSFEGLPEDWQGRFGKGAFDLKGRVPKFNLDVCKIHQGWFKDTVAPFVTAHNRPLPFLHMDADLYSSTLDVLIPANNLIVPGTVLLFDEYVINNNDDEHRALVHWMRECSRSVEYLWRTKWSQVAVRVTR